MLEIGAAGADAEGEGPERGTLESQSSACNGERNHPMRSRGGLCPGEGLASSRTTAPSTSSSSPSSPPPSPPDGNNRHTRVGGGDKKASRSDTKSNTKKRKLVEDDGSGTEPRHHHPHLLEGERGGQPCLFSSSAGLSSLPSSSYASCSVSHRLSSPSSVFSANSSSPSHNSCSPSSPSPQPPLALVSSSHKTVSSDVSQGKNLSELCLGPGASPSDSSPFFMSVFFTSRVNSSSAPPYLLLSLLLEYLPLSSLLFSLLPCSRAVFRITSDVFAESKKGCLASLSRASCPFFCPPSSLAASSPSSPVSSNSTAPIDHQGEKPPLQISFSQTSEETGNSDFKPFTTQMPKSISSSWRVNCSDREGYHQLRKERSSLIRIPIRSSDRRSTPVSFLLASVTPHRSRRKLLLSKLVIRPSELSLLHAKALPYLLFLQGHGVFTEGRASTPEAREACRQQRRAKSEEHSPCSPSPYGSASQRVSSLSSVSDRSGASLPLDVVADVPPKRLWELELSCLSVQHWKRLKRHHQQLHGADGGLVNEDEAATLVSFPRVFFLSNLAGLRLSNSEVNRHAAKVLRGCLLGGLLAEQRKRPNSHAESGDGESTVVGDRKGHNRGERGDMEKEKELEREEARARDRDADKDTKNPFISSSFTSSDGEEGENRATITHGSRDPARDFSSGSLQSSPLPPSSSASTGCKHSCLQSIVFSRCAVSSAAFHSLCVLTLPLLHSRLRSLHLVDCRLTAADAPFLGYALLHLPLVEELNLSNNLLGEDGGLILLLALLFNSFHRSRQTEVLSDGDRQHVDNSRGRDKHCGTPSPPGSTPGDSMRRSAEETSEYPCDSSRSHQELLYSSSACSSSQSPSTNNFLKERKEGNVVAPLPSEGSSVESSAEHARIKRNHELFSFSVSDVSLGPLSSSSSSEHASVQDTSVTLPGGQVQSKNDEKSNSSAFFPFHPTISETGHHQVSLVSSQSSSTVACATHTQDRRQGENLFRRSLSPAGLLSSLNLSGNDLSGENGLFVAMLSHVISAGSPPLRHLDLANNRFHLETLFVFSDALRQKKTRRGEARRQGPHGSEMTGGGGGTERNGGRSGRERVRSFGGEEEEMQKEKKLTVREEGTSEKDRSVQQNHHSNKEVYRYKEYGSEDHCLFSGEQYIDSEEESPSLLIDLRENFCMCNRSSSGGGEGPGDSHTRQPRGCIVPLESSIIEEFRHRERIEGRRASTGRLQGLQASQLELSLSESKGDGQVGKAADLFLKRTSHNEGEKQGKPSLSSTATSRRAIEISEGSCEREGEERRTHPMHGKSSTQRQDGCGDEGMKQETENSLFSSVDDEHQKRREGWQASSERSFVYLDECECALASERREGEKKEKERSLKDYYDALEDTQKYQLAELLKNDRGFADTVLDLCEPRQERHPGDNPGRLHRRGRERKAVETETGTGNEETLEEAAITCGTDLEVQGSGGEEEEEKDVRGRRKLRSGEVRKEDEDEIVEKRETLSTRLLANGRGVVWKDNEGKEAKEEQGKERRQMARVEDVQGEALIRAPALIQDLSINGTGCFPSSSSSAPFPSSSSRSSCFSSCPSSFPHGRLVVEPALSSLKGAGSIGEHFGSQTPSLSPESSPSSSLVDPPPTPSPSYPSVLPSGSSTRQTIGSLNLVPCSQAASTASHAAQSSSDGGENEGRETEEEEEETEGSAEDEEEEDEEEEDVEDEDDEEDGDERCFFFRGRNVKAPASVLLRKKVSRLQKRLQLVARDRGNEEGESEVSHGIVHDLQRYASLHRGHSEVNSKKAKDEKEEGQQTKGSTTSSESGVRTHHDDKPKKEQMLCSRVEEVREKHFIEKGRPMEDEERRQETDVLPTPRLKRERPDKGEEEEEETTRKAGDWGSTHRTDQHEDVKYHKKEVQPPVSVEAGGALQAVQQDEEEDESYNEESDAEDDTCSDSSCSSSDDGEEEEDLDEEELMDLIKDATSDAFFSPFSSSSSSSSACKRRRGL